MNTTPISKQLFNASEQAGLIPILKHFGNNLHFRIPMSQAFWDTRIDSLNLSTRSHNGLMRIGAITIGEVSELIMSEHGLEGVRNLGRKSIAEIKTTILAECYNQLGPKARLTFWEHFVENNEIVSMEDIDE